MADPAGTSRQSEGPKTWRDRLTEGVLGLAGGLGINALSADFGYGGAVVAAGFAAVLLAANRVRRLPQGAPLVRIASVGSLASAMLAMVFAVLIPESSQGYAVIGAVMFATGAVLIPSDLVEALGTLFDVAAIGVGVALMRFSVATVVDGGALPAAALIGLGVASIGGRVAILIERRTLFGVATIGAGVPPIGRGVAFLIEGHTLLGVVLIGLGVA